MMRQGLFILLCSLSVSYAISQAGIGITVPHASAMLDVTSMDKGFLPPRMTTAQRNTITSPAVGLTIYNTTVNCLQWYNGTCWYDGCTTRELKAVIDTLPRGYFKDEFNFLSDRSMGDISSCLWDFGDGWTDDIKNPRHIYAEVGIFTVSLTVTNIDGCSATTQMTVVVPEFVQLPKVITPNGDGFNDKFIIPATDINEFELIIKNRSGEVVFTSKAARLAWDGTSQSGIPMPQGTYYYILKEVGSKDYYKQGSFTLLRD